MGGGVHLNFAHFAVLIYGTIIGVLFATHSLGLARSSAEHIYAVQIDVTGNRKVRLFDKIPRLAEFAGQLSFSGQHELGFDKILLVEGVTEGKTIQQFLRKYGKDHHILLLPMGGSSLINGSQQTQVQLEEIKRITPNIFALIDSEKVAQSDSLEQSRQDFLQVCSQAGINCHVLQRRATENYLTDRAVKQVKGNNFSELLPYELLKNHTPGWGKSENWLIAHEMTRTEIEGNDLGQFLAAL